MLKTSASYVMRIGQRFVIKSTFNRKVGSGCPRAPTKKDDDRPKMTILKGIKNTFVEHSKNSKY